MISAEKSTFFRQINQYLYERSYKRVGFTKFLSLITFSSTFSIYWAVWKRRNLLSFGKYFVKIAKERLADYEWQKNSQISIFPHCEIVTIDIEMRRLLRFFRQYNEREVPPNDEKENSWSEWETECSRHLGKNHHFFRENQTCSKSPMGFMLPWFQH